MAAGFNSGRFVKGVVPKNIKIFNEDLAEKLYVVDKKSCTYIAGFLGLKKGVIRDRLIKRGVKIRNRQERGKLVTRNSYISEKDNLKQYKIYLLKEPNSEKVRYIGLTGNSLEHRVKQHSRIYGNSRRDNWVINLKSKNLKPEIELIEDGLYFLEANKKEQFYIKLYKSFGAILVNSSIGGNSIMKGFRHRKETRVKMSIAAKGKTRFNLEEIRKFYNTGYSQKSIAGIFKTDQGTISRIINKVNYN